MLRLRSRQDGFTLVELVIVLVILGILMGIAIPQFLGSKKTALRREAAAAGATYRNAITSYQRQNMGRSPQAPGSADWTIPAKGPINRTDPTNPSYLANGVPTAVQGGRIAVLAGPAGAAPPPAKFGVFYQFDPVVRGGYTLVVTAADGSVICDGSSNPGPEVERC